jgi:hypothetical protein
MKKFGIVEDAVEELFLPVEEVDRIIRPEGPEELYFSSDAKRRFIRCFGRWLPNFS